MSPTRDQAASKPTRFSQQRRSSGGNMDACASAAPQFHLEELHERTASVARTPRVAFRHRHFRAGWSCWRIAGRRTGHRVHGGTQSNTGGCLQAANVGPYSRTSHRTGPVSSGALRIRREGVH
jgi:hypothetical protein